MKIFWSTESGRWEAQSTYAEKDVLKAARWRWDPNARCWWTDDEQRAARLAEHADGEDKTRLEAVERARVAVLEASRATDADVQIPVPEGLAYFPFQKAGIAYAIDHANTLIGDEMGLGKTIQALGVINSDPDIQRVLIICPASLRLNWKRESERWLVWEFNIGIAEGNSWPGSANFVIINYDILKRHHARLRETPWDLMVVDECHYIKGYKAQRTHQVLGKWDRNKDKILTPIPATRKIFMSGTPIANKPIEMWGIAHALAPETFKSWKYYVTRYCAGHQNGYGWDVGGSSNETELQEQLRGSFMIRRKKEEVLKELPPKRRQVIEIPSNGASGAVRAEMAAWESHEARIADLQAAVEIAKACASDAEYRDAVEQLTAATRAAFTDIARLRHETAVAKIPHVIEHLENCDGKIVCFAHHKDVVRAIMDHFGAGAVKLTGDDKMQDRQRAVDRFQNDSNCRVFVGSITAAGVGITLTASSHVVFAELDWVPGNMSQAEDRCHRIGQANSVLVQHLVLEGSLDARMARILVQKQEVIDKALDRKVDLKLPTIPVEASTGYTSREKVAADAAKITPEQIQAVHLGLRMLAGLCDGAASLDGMGFSKIDVQVGHSLARCQQLTPKQAALGRRLVNKYRRQLPSELVQEAKGE